MKQVQKIEDTEKLYKNLRDEIFKFARKRSRFSIEHFTIAEEGTVLTHQYKFLLHQIRMNLYQLRLWAIDKLKYERQIEKIQEKMRNLSGTEIRDKFLDIKLLKYQTLLEDLNINIKGRLDELNDQLDLLSKIREKYGKEITWKDYEKDEAKYWRQFLARKAASKMIDRYSGCGVGEAESILEATMDPVDPNDQKMMDLPSDLNELIQIAKGKDGIGEMKSNQITGGDIHGLDKV